MSITQSFDSHGNQLSYVQSNDNNGDGTADSVYVSISTISRV
jgi:hypothetical protein